MTDLELEQYVIAEDQSDLAYDGSFTFLGILRKYFFEYDMLGRNIGISRHWNATTKKTYISHYEKRILPVIDKIFGNEYPMALYTSDDFERILSTIQTENHYSQSMLDHFRHLLWVVYRAGYQHNLYPDNLFWEDVFDPQAVGPDVTEKHRVNATLYTRKSFSVDEEIKLIHWFQNLDPKTAPGTDIGLLLMFFLGLRNNEACGANFSSIHFLPGHPDMPVFDMVQSTHLGKSSVKSGGKTSNAPRVLPLFLPFYHFLAERKAHLEQCIRNGTLLLPDTIHDVNQLPLTCIGNTYSMLASAPHLTIAGRKLFDDIGIKKSELAVLQQILFQNEFRELLPEEKDPTTYLFRRNFATHLYQLGLSLAEIQYCMGHEIEDPSLTRNFFADSERLYQLGTKFLDFPWYVLFPSSPEVTILDCNSHIRQRNYVESDSIQIKLENNINAVHFTVHASEPKQTLSLSISADCPFTLSFISSSQTAEYSHVPVISRQMKELYKKRAATLQLGKHK